MSGSVTFLALFRKTRPENFLQGRRFVAGRSKRGYTTDSLENIMAAPTIILINPWITDFAAYDLWSKPLGLLTLAGFLRTRGYDVRFLDCLDIHHPGMKRGMGFQEPVRRQFGTGKFWRKEVEKPPQLAHVKRPYSRYGIASELFVEELQKVEKPAAILVTSLMTYWYPGVQEAILLARRVHPGVPVILGGIYARLCRTHAVRHSGADVVLDEIGFESPEGVLDLLDRVGVPRPGEALPGEHPPYPAFDLLRKADYVCVAASSGCPFRCRYCAGPFLNPRFTQRRAGDVLDEILYWKTRLGIRDVAFYDDALLVNAGAHMNVVLEKLVEMDAGLRLHAPNALHIREITVTTARLLRDAGFRTIRLGLETTDTALRGKIDEKVKAGEFEKAVGALRGAGFSRRDIGVYVLMGLPGQPVDSVKRTLEEVDRAGAVPYLAEYSPIPHTAMWDAACRASGLDLSEPLYQNNTLIPCWDEKQKARVPELRAMSREIRANPG